MEFAGFFNGLLSQKNDADGNWSKVDFARLSRAKNQEMKKYDFSRQALMEKTHR